MASFTLQEHGQERFKVKVSEIAERLRVLADRVERAGAIEKPAVGRKLYGYRAERILHEITWGIANLDLDRLFEIVEYADDREA